MKKFSLILIIFAQAICLQVMSSKRFIPAFFNSENLFRLLPSSELPKVFPKDSKIKFYQRSDLYKVKPTVTFNFEKLKPFIDLGFQVHDSINHRIEELEAEIIVKNLEKIGEVLPFKNKGELIQFLRSDLIAEIKGVILGFIEDYKNLLIGVNPMSIFIRDLESKSMVVRALAIQSFFFPVGITGEFAMPYYPALPAMLSDTLTLRLSEIFSGSKLSTFEFNEFRAKHKKKLFVTQKIIMLTLWAVMILIYWERMKLKKIQKNACLDKNSEIKFNGKGFAFDTDFVPDCGY